ncbi:MAG: aminoacyl--tRNA ligase-related protein [Candidatus Aenigmatarchaeota archaeon]
MFFTTAEEAAVYIVRHYLKSYRRLPLVIYQIEAKYRDEERPKRSLIRTREFPMLDAYSFDIDREIVYKLMKE